MRHGSTSENFICHACGKEFQDRNAREQAYQHARSTGHFVTGEVVTAYHYGHLREDDLHKQMEPTEHAKGAA